ncbi:pantothenate synthase [Quaeritorhiza haematococci]|nr:pantothenate synthase [Quaeritorhiza haematococci]
MPASSSPVRMAGTQCQRVLSKQLPKTTPPFTYSSSSPSPSSAIQKSFCMPWAPRFSTPVVPRSLPVGLQPSRGMPLSPRNAWNVVLSRSFSGSAARCYAQAQLKTEPDHDEDVLSEIINERKDKIFVVDSVQHFRRLRWQWMKEGKTVGFVPTMGALHEGHLSLAKMARDQCDVVVSSIFVNPAQFSPTEDLAKYPRTFEGDRNLLASIGCAKDGSLDFDSIRNDEAAITAALQKGAKGLVNEPAVRCIFLPPVHEMYPSGIELDVSKQQGTFVEVKGKSHQMEGVIRPHFFRGVATVVTKLLNIIQPDKAFFGQKDAQQCVVVRSLVRDLFIPCGEIVIGATMRDPIDGLALSSRNRYLSPQERAVAPALYQALCKGKEVFDQTVKSSPESGVKREAILEVAKSVISGYESRGVPVKFEYLSLAHPHTLQELDVITLEEGAIFSGAIRVGTTRIIDNILLGINLKQWAA